MKRPDYNMLNLSRAAVAAAFALFSFGAAARPAAAQTTIFDHGAVNPGLSPLGLNSAAPVSLLARKAR